MSHKFQKQIVCTLATLALASACSSVFAGAFQLMEQNTTNLGTAFAGTASLAEDASTNWYNSAGLSRICEEQVVVSAVGILSHSRLHVNQAFDQNGTPVSGVPASNRIYGQGIVPGLHYALRLDEQWVFGFSITSPFGLKANYLEGSQARYQGTRSELVTWDLTPSLSYNFCNGLSVGFGPDFVYGWAALDNVIRTPAFAIPGVGAFAATDGLSSTRLSGWGFGAHAGVLYEFNDCSRIGINYRSPLNFKARGTSQVTDPTFPAIAGGPINVIHDARASITFPETVVISGFHQLNDCWAIMADAQWTHWKRFQKLRIEDTTQGSSIEQPFNFRDNWRFAVGTSYQFDECLLGRFGLAYDRTPVKDVYRTTRIPDSDRTWVAIGGRYNLTPCLALDFGYAHLFFKKAALDIGSPTLTGVPAPFNGSSNKLRGNTRTSASLLGLQLTWDLG